ncbi:AI-2E family transporter [Paenibacillus turpanensis]|uniref:AI-2E family transporter n=1 Tax=Paenibacillus turpanensis TaxID=2689078 RepID=UPI00140C7483|nr:AI-2E family transporter [Paenibacillus turpanensis]
MERFIRNKWFVALIYLLLGLSVMYMLMQIRPLLSGVYNFISAILAPFVVAMIISYVLNPIVNMLSRRKVPRTIAVLLIYAVFIASVTIIVMNLIPMFLKQLNELNEHLPELTMTAQMIVNDVNDSTWLPEGVRSGLNRALAGMENALSDAISRFVNGIGATINFLLAAFIIPFLAFYMLKDIQLIEKTVLTFVPMDHRRQTIRLVNDIDKALGNYIRGQFIVCLIIGLCAFIGYWLIGMPYPLLLASVVALFNIIPYLGPFFGAAPAIILASTISWQMVLMVAGVNVVCQVLEGNVVSPQVVGRSLHLHPLLIIFALLAGGEIGGVIGLILAVPVFAVIKVIVHHIHLYYWRKKPI